MSKKKYLLLIPIVLLVCLCLFEYLFFTNQISSMQSESASSSVQTPLDIVHFDNANSRDTYFNIHNVKAAQQVSNGEGIKVGILDHSFAVKKHDGLYAGSMDFTNNPSGMNYDESHGYWMACVLREIAPKCEIYALCTYSDSEMAEVKNIVEAIDWAIENDIDILTYSGEAFTDGYRADIDAAVDKAVENGIVTTFIHYDNPNNIWPVGLWPLNSEKMSRDADLNIFPYDYNTFFVKNYIEYMAETDAFKRSQMMPIFMSISSTSPVTAGFVAILKSVNNNLTPQEYKDILINTSYSMDYYDYWMDRQIKSERVVDIKKALDFIMENKP